MSIDEALKIIMDLPPLDELGGEDAMEVEGTIRGVLERLWDDAQANGLEADRRP